MQSSGGGGVERLILCSIKISVYNGARSGVVSPDGLWTEANLRRSSLSLAPCGFGETALPPWKSVCDAHTSQRVPLCRRCPPLPAPGATSAPGLASTAAVAPRRSAPRALRSGGRNKLTGTTTLFNALS